MHVALMAIVALAAVQPACSSSIRRSALDDTDLVDSQLGKSTRLLQNAANTAEVVPVSTAAELRAALADTGSSHIVLNEHMDLTAIGGLGGSAYLLGLIPANVKSIRVRSGISVGVLCRTLPGWQWLSDQGVNVPVSEGMYALMRHAEGVTPSTRYAHASKHKSTVPQITAALQHC